jgi:methylmalonyl-CoA mutase
LNSKGSPTILPAEVIRATEEEKHRQIETVEALIDRNRGQADNVLKQLQQAAIDNRNMFEMLMEAAKVCSLGQITQALFDVGGQYRRNM